MELNLKASYLANKVIGEKKPSYFESTQDNQRIGGGFNILYNMSRDDNFNLDSSFDYYEHDFEQKKVTSSIPSSSSLSHEYMTNSKMTWQHMLNQNNLITTFTGYQGEVFDGERVDKQKYRYTTFIGIQDEIFLFNDRLILVPGLRIDNNSDYKTFPAPKLSGLFKLVPDFMNLRASVGRGVKVPTFKDLYIDFVMPGSTIRVVGNPELEPESSWGTNAGFELYKKDFFNFNVNGFFNNLRNQISAVIMEENQAEMLYMYKNYDKSYSTGVEANLSLNIIKNISLSVGYSFVSAKYYDSEIDKYIKMPLIPKHNGNFKLAYINDKIGFKAIAFGEYIGKQSYEGDTSDIYIDDYINLHARVEKTVFSDDLNIFIAGDNLLNHKEIIPFLPGLFVKTGISYRME